eukprot:756904-Hanusia_phi.AAC.3
MTFIEKIPRDLLFIIRTQNLVRALCSDLGEAEGSRLYETRSREIGRGGGGEAGGEDRRNGGRLKEEQKGRRAKTSHPAGRSPSQRTFPHLRETCC